MDMQSIRSGKWKPYYIISNKGYYPIEKAPVIQEPFIMNR